MIREHTARPPFVAGRPERLDVRHCSSGPLSVLTPKRRRRFEIADATVTAWTAHPDVARAVIAEGRAPTLGERPLMRRYGTTLRAAVREAQVFGDLEAEVSPSLFAGHLTAMTAGHFIRWVNTAPDDGPDANRLRTAVEHAVALTSAAVADDAALPALRCRQRAAEASLPPIPN